LTNYVRCLLCWAFCFALLALGQKFFSRKNEFIRYFADASYWFYWMHLPVTFYFSMILQPVELNSLFKVYIAIVASTVLIFLMYMLFVRNTILGDYFCGWRKPIKEDPFLKYLMEKWKPLAVKNIAFGFVAFSIGQVMHISILKKNNALLVSRSSFGTSRSFVKQRTSISRMIMVKTLSSLPSSAHRSTFENTMQ